VHGALLQRLAAWGGESGADALYRAGAREWASPASRRADAGFWLAARSFAERGFARCWDAGLGDFLRGLLPE